MNCSFCKVELIRGTVNHKVVLKDRSIIIKDVPAKICMECGEYYVDTETAINLEDMIVELKKDKHFIF